MEVRYRKCAGLEVRRDVVIACARVMTGRKVSRELGTFPLSARGLFALGDWLAQREVTHVGVEAIGRWRSVWMLLAGRVSCVLIAAAEIDAVPGRETSASWLADALALGVVLGGVEPPGRDEGLHEMIETREQMSRDRVQHAGWMLELLEGCGLRLATSTSDILGPGARAFLLTLTAGEEDPNRLAQLAQGTFRARRGALVDALPGRILDHHRFLLGTHLRMIENYEEGRAALEVDLDKALEALEDGRRGAALAP
jgi:hypothetical protein